MGGRAEELEDAGRRSTESEPLSKGRCEAGLLLLLLLPGGEVGVWSGHGEVGFEAPPRRWNRRWDSMPSLVSARRWVSVDGGGAMPVYDEIYSE